MPPDLHRFTTAAAHRAAPSMPAKAQPADVLLTAKDIWAEMRHSWFNEDPNGLPTHFPTIAPHWSWLPDEVTLVTGWPNHGKSELMLQFMLTKSVYEKEWTWALYVPENMPARRIITKLVQSYVGQTANPKSPRRMNFDQYEEAAHWVLEHFHLINPRKAASLPELLPALAHAATVLQVKGYLIDPWNSLASSIKEYGGREDEMLRAQLNQLLDFTEDHHQCGVVCAHPSGEARTREGTLKVPDQYNVSGGRMWANKVDNFLVVHRPFADENPAHTAVDFFARKIKQEGLVGIKTPREGVRLGYDRDTSRYLDPKIGHAPLDVLARQRYEKHKTNDPAEIQKQQVVTQGDFKPHLLATSTASDFSETEHFGALQINSSLLRPSPDENA